MKRQPNVSVFAPPPVQAIAIAIQGAATTIGGILKALDDGLSPDIVASAAKSAAKDATAKELR